MMICCRADVNKALVVIKLISKPFVNNSRIGNRQKPRDSYLMLVLYFRCIKKRDTICSGVGTGWVYQSNII